MSNAVCVSCRRSIDRWAKVCPYCGANPETGERIDTQAMLQEVFHTREMTATESVLEYARHRQGMVIAITAIVAFLILAVIHSIATARNGNIVSDAPAVPLTEITDLSNQSDETKPQDMPTLLFQYDGNPQTMRHYIVEPGAVTPPEIVAAQQAAAAAQQAAAQQAAAAQHPPQAQPQPAPPVPQPQHR